MSICAVFNEAIKINRLEIKGRFLFKNGVYILFTDCPESQWHVTLWRQDCLLVTAHSYVFSPDCFLCSGQGEDFLEACRSNHWTFNSKSSVKKKSPTFLFGFVAMFMDSRPWIFFREHQGSCCTDLIPGHEKQQALNVSTTCMMLILQCKRWITACQCQRRRWTSKEKEMKRNKVRSSLVCQRYHRTIDPLGPHLFELISSLRDTSSNGVRDCLGRTSSTRINQIKFNLETIPFSLSEDIIRFTCLVVTATL